MFLHHRIRRVAGDIVLGAGALGASATIVIGATHPAAAAAALATVQSAVACATTGTTPCVSGTNSSSGIGVLGASNTGTGIRGTSNTNNGVKGSSKTGLGVLGTTVSGSAGIEGSATESTGVFGFTTGNGGQGVGGVSRNGVGVIGDSTGGTGVQGISTTGTGIVASSSSANALFAVSNDNGVIAQAGQFPLVVQDLNGNDNFFVNAAGDVFFHGQLRNIARLSGGAMLTAFSPKTTLPTVEDTGTAQLVGGAAAVRLDPTFATSIDARSTYRVFLTPNGDTPHGLFVASKTPNGFIVREAQGGRSTVTFDYRVVATAAGQAGQRMAVTSNFAMPRVSLPVIPKSIAVPIPQP
jgi:hypothetical protein